MEPSTERCELCRVENVELRLSAAEPHVTSAVGALTVEERVRGSTRTLSARWEPYEAYRSAEKYRFRIPTAAVRNAQRTLPFFGGAGGSVRLLLTSGVALPPLHFPAGGLDRFWAELRDGTPTLQQSGDRLEQLAVASPRAAPLPPGAADAAASVGAPKSENEWALLGAFGAVTQLARAAARGTGELLFGADASGDASCAAAAATPLPPTLSPEWVELEKPSSGGDSGATVGSLLRLEQWHGLLDVDGRLLDAGSAFAAVAARGVCESLRPTVWPLLLRVHPHNSSRLERAAIDDATRAEYARLCGDVRASLAAPSEWEEEVSWRIEKDVTRTDRDHALFAAEDSQAAGALRRVLLAYSLSHRDVGYCQGMSDFCSVVIVALMHADGCWQERDEFRAYACFGALMLHIDGQFAHDQSGMHRQLEQLARVVREVDPEFMEFLVSVDASNFFFVFRWLLVHFKRELEFAQTCDLWERLWADGAVDGEASLVIYAAAATLLAHRGIIAARQMEFDDLLIHCNCSMADTFDVVDLCNSARALRATHRSV